MSIFGAPVFPPLFTFLQSIGVKSVNIALEMSDGQICVSGDPEVGVRVNLAYQAKTKRRSSVALPLLPQPLSEYTVRDLKVAANQSVAHMLGVRLVLWGVKILPQ